MKLCTCENCGVRQCCCVKQSDIGLYNIQLNREINLIIGTVKKKQQRNMVNVIVSSK